MEVFKFNLEFEKRWWQGKKTVKQILINAILKRNNDTDSFKMAWEQLERTKTTLACLANAEDILYANEKKDFTYYIIKKSENSSGNLSHYTIEVLVNTNKDISKSLKEVISDISKLCWLSITNLSTSKLIIYPIDAGKNDIQGESIQVETEITKSLLNHTEIIAIFLGIILLILGYTAFKFKLSPDETIAEFASYYKNFLFAGASMALIPLIKYLFYFPFPNRYGIKILSAENVLSQNDGAELPKEKSFSAPKIPPMQSTEG